MSAAWFDARGCLTPEGMATLQRSVPGAAPAVLATHLAGCPRCQQSLLSVGRTQGAAAAPDPGRLWRNLAILGAALLMLMVGMFLTIYVTR